jgi:creatinine amidohydrolase
MGKWKFPPEGGHMDKPSGIYLQTMTTKGVEDRLEKNDIIIIPVGSTENHGGHGPIGEDTFLVTRMAEEVAKATGCTVAEPIWYGCHPFHHLGQPGTVVIPDQVLSDYLRAVMAGLWNTGFRKQIYMSLHGQEFIVPSAIHEFGKRYQVPAVLIYLDIPPIMGDAIKDKEHGGPFETPFRHACEAEQSLSLALFPELCQPENAEDTTPWGFFPEGHIDKGGDVYHYPIPGHCQVGGTGIECVVYPEGAIGKPSLATAEKGYRAIEVFLDYLKKLHDDILAKFPPGVLPEIQYMTQRNKEDMEALLRGPTKGGKHIYTIAFPP